MFCSWNEKGDRLNQENQTDGKVEGTVETLNEEREKHRVRTDSVQSSSGTSESGEASAERPKKKKGGSHRALVRAQAAGAEIPHREIVNINLKSLLEAGAHFGHQTSRWCPAMAPYIFTARNGIHIINLPRTIQSWEAARRAIVETTAAGGTVLFVGTKKQAQDAIVEEARRCGAFFVSRRWLGGMMTNFPTIRKSIDRMNKLATTLHDEEASLAAGAGSKFTKKERLMMEREREKLEFSLGGIKEMYSAPSIMFAVDIKREDIAIKEARRLDIPVIALVDTNCDPRTVTFPIPSNDDGTRAIRLFASAVADAVIEGRKQCVVKPQSETQHEQRRSRSARNSGAAQASPEAQDKSEPLAADSAASSDGAVASDAAGSSE